MDLPAFRRGLELVSADLNKLSNAVRSVSVTSVIGGTFNRTPGGTTIVVDQQVRGGGSSAPPCPFTVTDVSEPKQPSGLTLKIQVSQNPVLGTANDTYPKGRYPNGMSANPNSPPYKLEIQQTAGTEYVYVNILVDQTGEILPASTAITISSEPDFSVGNSTYQKFLIAVIEKVLDDDQKPYISQITNTCPIVYAQPAPPCPFLVEDDSRDGATRVTVRSGLVANELPDNMTLTDTFRLAISTTQDFWVIYCGMVVENGVIQTDPGDITIFASQNYETNTSTYVYFKLAELTLSQRANGDWYASYILNTCAVPFLSGGGTTCAYFAVSDATDGSTLRVKVAQNQIAGRWPQGMGPSNPDFYLVISQTCYIYAAILWDIQSLTIESSSSAITILQSNDLLPNTDTMQYILLSTVTVSGNPDAITKILNVCSQPVPNPCLLDWST
jgi:hypothetical protein